MGEEFLRRDPRLYAIWKLILRLLSARTYKDAISALAVAAPYLTAEAVFVLSELCYQFSRDPRYRRQSQDTESAYAALNAAFEAVRCLVTLADRTDSDVAQSLSALSTDHFLAGSRTEQVLFNDSIAAIVAAAERIDISRVDAFIFGWLATWTATGIPSGDTAQALLRDMNRLYDNPIKEILSGRAAARRTGLSILVRSYLASGGLKRAGRSFLYLLGYVLPVLLVLLAALLSIRSRRTGATVVPISLAASAAVLLSLALRRSRRGFRVHGATIGHGQRARAFINARLAEDEFRRAVDHELVHLAKQLGHTARDVPTVYEAFVAWTAGRLDGARKRLFEDGVRAGSSASPEASRIVESYLAGIDATDSEHAYDYSMGYYIFGVIVALCKGDESRVTQYIRSIMHGETAQQALDAAESG